MTHPVEESGKGSHSNVGWWTFALIIGGGIWAMSGDSDTSGGLKKLMLRLKMCLRCQGTSCNCKAKDNEDIDEEHNSKCSR